MVTRHSTAALAPLMMTFARVTAAGSFSAAARELGMTRAAVAKQVAQLERSLGAQLLRRTTRTMSLTEAGETFAGHCLRLESEAAAARDAVATMVGAPRGLLRVACPMSFAVSHLAATLCEFAAAQPEVRLDLALDDGFVDLVAGRFDVVVRIANLEDSTLVARRLARVDQALAASPAYLAHAGRPHSIDDLVRCDALVYSRLSPPDLWRFRDGRSVRVPVRLAADNGEMLVAAATAGLGICRLPGFLVDPEFAAGRLERVLEREPLEEVGIYALTAPGRRPPPKVAAFVDFLAERLGPRGRRGH